MKVCHLVSVHGRKDIRIFHKECRSLAAAGHEVTLIVADGKPDEVCDNVSIQSVKKFDSRIKRMIKAPPLIFKKALSVKADVYHFHNPELIPIALKLKRLGKKVIFDSQEDIEKQLLSKPYFNKFVGMIVSKIYYLYERYAVKKFDLILAATPFIRDKLKKIHPNVIDINNYPILGELNQPSINFTERENTIAFIGSIDEIRGTRQMIKALEYCKTDIRLKLAGIFHSQTLRNQLIKYNGWKKVDEIGYVDRQSIKKILSEVRAGIAVFLPVPNFIHSRPNKLFEYMSAGLPVIASNFPLWKSIIEDKKCGITVDPEDPIAISKAIDWIINNPEEAQTMGKNGLNAVKALYNWQNEEKKLIEVYKSL
jgi:glycosyltransferase involved in cell wall biosynthesis